MNINPLMLGFRREVTRAEKEFQLAREREVGLKQFATVTALCVFLAERGSEQSRTRVESIKAVAREARRSKHPAWIALLAIAHEPMLQKIARSVRDEDHDGLEQALATAFIEAARRMGRSGECESPSGYLKQVTNGIFFGDLKAERDAPEMISFDDEADYAANDNAIGDTVSNAADLERAVRRRRLAPSTMRMLLATVGGDEGLRKYVTRAFPAANEREGRRIRRELARERVRVLGRLRRELVPAPRLSRVGLGIV